jgi:hypothetical protein
MIHPSHFNIRRRFRLLQAPFWVNAQEPNEGSQVTGRDLVLLSLLRNLQIHGFALSEFPPFNARIASAAATLSHAHCA